MTAIAMVSGAARHHPLDRTPDRARGLLEQLATLGPIDLVIIHDTGSLGPERTSRRTAVVPPDGVRRLVEVAADPMRRSGMLREVHLHRSIAPERDARRTAWFRLVDSFLASAPTAHDLVWCADLASLKRAEWLRVALPAAVDIDRFEDLGSGRARRAARRSASTAHLVTMDTADRRDRLGLPGSAVVAPGDPTFPAAIAAVVAQAAAYRPARTT